MRSKVESDRFKRRCRCVTATPGTLPRLVILMLFLLNTHAAAQTMSGREVEDKTIEAAVQAEIIDSVAQALNEVYVYPEVAKKMEKHLRQQLKEGAYKNLTSCREFAERLTRDLQEISKDRHLGVRFATEEMIQAHQDDTLTEVGKKRELKELHRDNFGFKKVELLEGNIGYVDFRVFADARDAGPTAIAALNFLAYTDAVIFDLRRNGGGDPSMIQLLMHA